MTKLWLALFTTGHPPSLAMTSLSGRSLTSSIFAMSMQDW